MEGSTKSNYVDNYDKLAEYYDELLQDEESLSYWLNYIEEKKFSSVLELASGSGVMAKILKQKGYNITASDISEKMMIASKKNYDGEYLILDMTNYHLNKKYDLVLCICDSINYLDNDELTSFFKCAYEHLNEGGRLIFDMHSIARLDEFKDQYIEEGYIGNKVPYQWTIMSDIDESLINEHFTFYTNDGMIQEHRTQHVFSVDEIKEKMSEFFNVRVIEDFIEDEKLLVIGDKK